ncbi:MAG: hypothetical protein ACRC44_08540 [Bifidobacterium asteroides]
MELMEAGFFQSEALDLVTLDRDIPKDLSPLAAYEMKRKALERFGDSLTAPTSNMIGVLIEHHDALLDQLEDELAGEDDAEIDFVQQDRRLQAIDRAQPLHRRVYRALYQSAPIFFIRSRLFGHMFR